MKQYKFTDKERYKAIGWFTQQIARLPEGKAYMVEIKEHRAKRSLDANAYCWALITELGNVLRQDKELVYIEMLKHYGQSEIISVRSNIDVKGYFKYYEPIGTGHVGNKEFTHYKVFKGSSEYDTCEMSILIDGVIQECQEQGIETMTPDEVERLKVTWQ